MSGTNGTTQQNVLSTNAALLQPTTGYYRLFDALWLLMMSSPTATGLPDQIATLQQQFTSMSASVADLNTQIDSLQGQITTLNGQVYDLNTAIGNINTAIGTINARLTAAGIP